MDGIRFLFPFFFSFSSGDGIWIFFFFFFSRFFYPLFELLDGAF